MEIHHDQELERIEEHLTHFAHHLDGMVVGTSAFMDPEIDGIYREVIGEVVNIKMTALQLADECRKRRIDVHKTASFNRAYFQAYGVIHPDAIGIIDEKDVAEEEY